MAGYAKRIEASARTVGLSLIFVADLFNGMLNNLLHFCCIIGAHLCGSIASHALWLNVALFGLLFVGLSITLRASLGVSASISNNGRSEIHPLNLYG